VLDFGRPFRRLDIGGGGFRLPCHDESSTGRYMYYNRRISDAYSRRFVDTANGAAGRIVEYPDSTLIVRIDLTDTPARLSSAIRVGEYISPAK
jgi:hypothetical protein